MIVLGILLMLGLLAMAAVALAFALGIFILLSGALVAAVLGCVYLVTGKWPSPMAVTKVISTVVGLGLWWLSDFNPYVGIGAVIGGMIANHMEKYDYDDYPDDYYAAPPDQWRERDD